MEQEKKKCSSCKKLKLLTEFGSNKHNASGLQDYCRVCKNASQKKFLLDNPGYYNEYMREYFQRPGTNEKQKERLLKWREANPDYHKNYYKKVTKKAAAKIRKSK